MKKKCFLFNNSYRIFYQIYFLLTLSVVFNTRQQAKTHRTENY